MLKKYLGFIKKLGKRQRVVLHATSENLLRAFASNPSTFTIYRGENSTNKGGLHFTTDENWAKNFGSTILTDKLPLSSKIKLLTKADFETGAKLGLNTEKELWNFFFEKDYDAIVGYDAMNSEVIDIIVNPKHLDMFNPSNLL